VSGLSLNRRGLLIATISGGVAALSRVFFGSGPSAGPDLSEQDVAKWVEVALGRSPALEEIGDAYLSENPAENDFETLRNKVFASPYESAQAFEQSVKIAIRDDFAHSRVIALRGWQLSLTEVRCCALLFLSAGDSRS